jgi:hypothetical protein
VLGGLISLSYIERRKRIFFQYSQFIGILNYTCWFSPALRWYEYNVSFYEQRFLAVILLGITLWVIRQLSRLKPEIKILFMTAFDANDNDL